MDSSIRLRMFKDLAFKSVVFLLAFLSIMPLVFILGYLVKNGVSALKWEFLVNLPKPVGEEGGGIVNAIVGTLMLMIVACLVAVPIGTLSGIYLAEFRKTRLASIMRFCVEILQGIPSIVIGIIAYAWIVMPTGTFSALSGGLALSMMMLPVIIRSTEETLKMIPHELKEAAVALGIPYYRTILKVIVPSGISGITTGILLSVARIAGETAPLLFTAFGNPFMNLNAAKPVDSLPLVIYNYATSPYPEWHKLAWGASFVLIIIVLSLNLAAKRLSRI